MKEDGDSIHGCDLAWLWAVADLFLGSSMATPTNIALNWPTFLVMVLLWAAQWGFCVCLEKGGKYDSCSVVPTSPIQNMALYADVSGKQFPVTRGQDVGRYQVRDTEFRVVGETVQSRVIGQRLRHCS